MKRVCHFLWVAIFALYSFIPLQGHAKEFEHNIQLQLSDSYGFPVPGSEFWVKINVIKKKNKVTLQLPTINFVTGPSSNNPFIPSPPVPAFVPGGYLYTASGYLPKDVRPNDIVYRSWIAASNNRASLPFSFAQDPSTLPVPPSGYILQVTNAGALVVQCAGTFGNIIPPGPQILLPTEISYIVEPKIRLKRNTKLSTGPTNTTQFTNPIAFFDGFRDTHFNDAFDGVAVWAWADNSTVADKTNGTINLMVAVGKKGKDGKLKVKRPIQLTDLPPEVGVWDTSVAINRTNKNNIVVSYGVINNVTLTAEMYRAVSFDGGKTWPENGPTNIQPTGLAPGGFGDNRGVASDKYGNIWYLSTNYYDDAGNLIDQPFFAVSTDGGVTFELFYTLPYPDGTFDGASYDYPQFCFGGDGLGNYGIQFVTDFIPSNQLDILPGRGFIPIYGLGNFGTPTYAQFPSFTNAIEVASITASEDGRVWTFGPTFGVAGTISSYISPLGMVFKSPGALDLNNAGPWNYAIVNYITQFGLSIYASQPDPIGYILNSPQSNLFDDERQALYGIVAANYPDYSQNMRLYFCISRDNAQTWSNPIDISTTDFANRGFQSMALDSVKGDLYFGWYDGRNDRTFQSVDYYATVIPANKLDKLVNKIPLSNPLYSLPSAAVPLEGAMLEAKPKGRAKSRQDRRFGHLRPKRSNDGS